MDKFNYKQGMMIPVSNIVSLNQDAAYNNIRAMHNILTDRYGFVGDAFKPEFNTSTTLDGSDTFLTMTAGTVLFPSGDIFPGNGFTYNMPIEPSGGSRYLIIQYINTKSDKGDYADEAYSVSDQYTVYDHAVKIYLTESAPYYSAPINNSKRLLIARINYVPGTSQATPLVESIIDMRKSFSPYLSSAYSVNPLDIVEAIDYTSKYSQSMRGSGFNDVAAPFDDESILYERLGFDSLAPGYYWLDILYEHIKTNEAVVLSRHSISAPPFNFYPSVPIVVDDWTAHKNYEAILGTRRIVKAKLVDINSNDIGTEYSDSFTLGLAGDNGYTPEVLWDLEWHPIMPLLKVYPYTEAAPTDGLSYIQIWADDTMPNIRTTPPRKEVILPHVPTTKTPGHNIILPPGQTNLSLAKRAVTSGNRACPIDYQYSSKPSYGNTSLRSTISLSFGGDGVTTGGGLNERVQRWYFSESSGEIYPIATLMSPSENIDPNLASPGIFIVKIEYWNYASDNTSPPSGYLYADNQYLNIIIEPETTGASDFVHDSWEATNESQYIHIGGEPETDIHLNVIACDGVADDYLPFCGVLKFHVIYKEYQ